MRSVACTCQVTVFIALTVTKIVVPGPVHPIWVFCFAITRIIRGEDAVVAKSMIKKLCEFFRLDATTGCERIFNPAI